MPVASHPITALLDDDRFPIGWPSVLLAVADRQGDPEALEARLGRPLDNTRAVSIRDGVAVIPITGPIMRYANLFTRISGATSTQELATDLQTALDSPQVRAIVLNIDSPGGEASGINELADMIHASRGKKPIKAYVGGTGASAAYWIASAADEPERLYIEGTGSFEFERTASRLREMRDAAWGRNRAAD